jgi:hypothetical protein
MKRALKTITTAGEIKFGMRRSDGPDFACKRNLCTMNERMNDLTTQLWDPQKIIFLTGKKKKTVFFNDSHSNPFPFFNYQPRVSEYEDFVEV